MFDQSELRIQQLCGIKSYIGARNEESKKVKPCRERNLKAIIVITALSFFSAQRFLKYYLVLLCIQSVLKLFALKQ